MRVQVYRTTSGAPFGSHDTLRGYARPNGFLRELGAQIELSRPARAPPEGPQDFDSNLIAGSADRRPEIDGHIRGRDPETTFQDGESGLEYAACGSSPTRVKEGDAATFNVDDKHRNAIRGRNRQEDASLRGQDSVGLTDNSGYATRRRVRLHDAGPMHLARHHR